MKITPEEANAMVTYQIGALKAFLDAEGMEVHLSQCFFRGFLLTF